MVYGSGIFMTISPGERHNYLAIRLCRYRTTDPFVAADTANAKKQRPWCGQDRPSLDAKADDVFEFEIPGYDLRRLMQAQDPLCVVNAFFVQVRVVLATILGIRMCPHCPHCATTCFPCQDVFGSSAEAMGGVVGCSDGLCGTVECQKVNTPAVRLRRSLSRR